MPGGSGTQGPLRRSPPAPVQSRLALPVPSLVSDRSIRGQRRCQERFSVKLTGLGASVESWLERIAIDLVEQDRDGRYYAAATKGEAHLLLGDEAAARTALGQAAALNAGDHGALATTRRQLRLVCELAGIDDELLGLLAGP